MKKVSWILAALLVCGVAMAGQLSTTWTLRNVVDPPDLRDGLNADAQAADARLDALEADPTFTAPITVVSTNGATTNELVTVDAVIDGEHIKDDTIDDDSIDLSTGAGLSAADMPNEDVGDLTITTGSWTLDANVVDSDQYVDGSIDLEHLADSSVDSQAIVDGVISNGDLSADCLDSANYIAASIDLEHMASSSVDGDNLVDGTVSNVDLAANAVTTDKILDGTIGPADLASTVTNALTALTSGKVIIGSVAGVATPITLSGAMTNSPLGVIVITAGAVDTDELATGAVTGAKVDPLGSYTCAVAVVASRAPLLSSALTPETFEAVTITLNTQGVYTNTWTTAFGAAPKSVMTPCNAFSVTNYYVVSDAAATSVFAGATGATFNVFAVGTK